MSKNVVRIIRAVAADAQELNEIARQTGIDAWTAADYVDEMCRDDSIVLKAAYDMTVVGFLVSRVVPGRDGGFDAELYNIAVRADFRRMQTGSKLITALIHELKRRQAANLWLEVRASNQGAARFYDNMGFSPVSRRSNFYSNPVEDALIMIRKVGA